MVTTIIDISQVNMEELIRDVREGKVARLLKQVIENNVMLLKLLELQVAKNQKRRREQEKEWRRKENKER